MVGVLGAGVFPGVENVLGEDTLGDQVVGREAAGLEEDVSPPAAVGGGDEERGRRRRWLVVQQQAPRRQPFGAAPLRRGPFWSAPLRQGRRVTGPAVVSRGGRQRRWRSAAVSSSRRRGRRGLASANA